MSLRGKPTIDDYGLGAFGGNVVVRKKCKFHDGKPNEERHWGKQHMKFKRTLAVVHKGIEKAETVCHLSEGKVTCNAEELF